MAFSKHFFFNSLNKLLHNKNCFQKANLTLKSTKNGQKVTFWNKRHFFINVARFARKYFTASKYGSQPLPNLFGHPVEEPKAERLKIVPFEDF